MSLHSDSIQTQNSYQESFLALKASAGSGKTFALTIRYISLLFCGASANQILAITFTKKATSEMYQRIKSALYELANLDIYPESSFFKVLQDEGLSAESIRKNAHRIYLEFLNSTTKILTIDAFLQSVLKKFCWYIGLCQDYKLLTSNKDAQDEILELFLGHLYRLDSRSNSSKNKYHPLCDLATFCQSLDIKPQSFISFVQRCYSDKIHFSQDFFKQFDYPNTQHLQPSIKALQDKILSTATALKALINAQPDASDRAKNLIKNENFKQLLGLGEYDTKLTWIEKDVEHNYWNKLFATNENLKNDFTQLLENLKNDCLHYFKLRDEMIFTQIASVLHLYDKAINQYIRKHQTLSFEDSTIKAYELLALGKDLGGIDPLFFIFGLITKSNTFSSMNFKTQAISNTRFVSPLSMRFTLELDRALASEVCFLWAIQSRVFMDLEAVRVDYLSKSAPILKSKRAISRIIIEALELFWILSIPIFSIFLKAISHKLSPKTQAKQIKALSKSPHKVIL
ncbi:helicase [Helicobacter fennelliae MRY12-0050]|uniref:Helicase n=1 Tax=Helicobacter fennelliae MRY12-0050 TaxID=1325130 RepID=T1DUZ1_9HELI|nr:helicase [Helicobacter fennelliae MRY12-0050]